MANNNTFAFVGKIVPCKETDSFSPYQVMWFNNSDWGKKQIKFNIVCGNDRHMIDVSTLINRKQDNSVIYTYANVGEKKSEKIDVAFKDRFKPEIVESIVEWRKFLIDTNLPSRRYNLENIIKKFNEGTVTDNDMNLLGVHSIEEAQSELKKAISNRKEFISEYDFIDAINELLSSDIGNMMFKVAGNYELEYSEKDGKWYRKFKATRIYRVSDDAEPESNGVIHIVFNKDSISESTDKIRINGFTPVYLSNYKKSFMSPISITVDGTTDEAAKKKMLGFKKLFTVKQGYKEMGVNVKFVDGAQVVELTEDMLTDEQRENIEFGLINLEDIKKELGKPVYGDRVTDIVAIKPAYGYSKGAVDTVYTSADFGKPSFSETTKAKSKPADDDVEDIFADDEI